MANDPNGVPGDETLPSGRAAGLLIGLASVLSVAFMVFHPTVHAHDTAELIAGVARKAVVNRVVHGSLIALVGALVCGFTCLSSRLGANSISARGGLVAYVMGAGTLIVAALVDGFIFPEFIARYEGRPTEELETLRPALALVWTVNQVCARAGVLAMSVAMILWSANMARRPGGIRVVGALGAIVGTLLVGALMTGNLPMNIHGVLAFELAYTVWALAVATLLIRQRI